MNLAGFLLLPVSTHAAKAGTDRPVWCTCRIGDNLRHVCEWPASILCPSRRVNPIGPNGFALVEGGQAKYRAGNSRIAGLRPGADDRRLKEKTKEGGQ